MNDVAYCLNPYCHHPNNASNQPNCYYCHFPLLVSQTYQASKLITTGRLGRTFRGQDIHQSRPCIIKQFFPKSKDGIFLNAEKAKQLFHSEASRLQQLGDHSQIPEFYGHLEQDGYQYIVQQWINGENLANELSHEGTFSERDIRQLLKSLLPILAYIHDRAVIHRDIKPENIIRRRYHPQQQEVPELVLVDFGAAKLASLSQFGQTGTIIGSPGYAAPEQVYGKPTFASDIYSLGVTCLHLLTGVSPLDLYNPLQQQLIWRDYQKDNPVSDSLAAILDGMTTFDLKQRYASAKEVLSALGVLSPDPPLQDKYNQATTAVIKLYSGKGAIYSVQFSPNCQFFASGGGSQWGKLLGKENCVRLFRVGDWEHHTKVSLHSAPVTTVQFSPDSKLLISSSRDKTIKIWHCETEQLQQTLQGHRFAINTLQVSPYGDVILSGSQGGEIILWNLKTGKRLNCLSLDQSVYAIAISPNGEQFAVGSVDSTIQIWDLYRFKPLFSLKGHIDSIYALDFSPEGHYLASGSGDWDCTVKVWELASKTAIQTLRGHQWSVCGVHFSPDGGYVASVSTDRSVQMVGVFQEKPIPQCWNHHTGAIHDLAFSPDGCYLASGSEDETVRIWTLEKASVSELASARKSG